MSEQLQRARVECRHELKSIYRIALVETPEAAI
jgi:hypothetical protein